MADTHKRVSIGIELLSKSEEIKVMEDVKIFYDSKRKAMLLGKKDVNENLGDDIYFLVIHKLDPKGRIVIPSTIRIAFPKATYLPVMQNGRIYILIIEHNEKSE